MCIFACNKMPFVFYVMERNEYFVFIDFCKFVAAFVVTWSHCAQCVSGMIWTNFLGGHQLDIAFTMPLFMIISGWLMNLDKMREMSAKAFVGSKFRRLIIPSFVWFCILICLTFNKPDLTIFTYYWYLDALFVCLCVIMICAKLFESDIVCCLISTGTILIIPYSDVAHINFMMPFLWVGYGMKNIRFVFNRPMFLVACSILGMGLLFMWNPSYSVYLAPFNFYFISQDSALIMMYRLVLGCVLSFVIISCAIKYENLWVCKVSQLGNYSLVFYTASLASLCILSNVLDSFHVHCNRFLLIDVLSLVLCLFILYVTVQFAEFCRKHRMLSALFLGE